MTGSPRPIWRRYGSSLHGLVTPAPVPRCLPAVWHYRDVRPFLMQSGSLITAQEATRRVLMLMNPGLDGQASITGSLIAGLQLIMPGEVAPAHRHTQSALRFVIEGHGAYTAVDGERTTMAPGDFVITPSWTWHDHGNDTQEPMVWLDGLDVQIVNLLNASFAEGYPEETQAISRPEGDSFARYGNNLLPIDWKPEVRTSPVFNYPYARTREALDTLGRNGSPDPYHGHKLRYVNPASGRVCDADHRHLCPATASGLRLAALSRDRWDPSSCASEGEGETRIGDIGAAVAAARHLLSCRAGRRIPTMPIAHSVLFSFSDRAVQEKTPACGREARGNALKNGSG